jgi:hypothetical protein
MNSAHEVPFQADTHWINLGVQYYASARHAFICSFHPVAANLFHLAVELLLKAGLAQELSEKELQEIGHWLPKAWEKLKERANDSSLCAFDKTIAELDRWERVRYPALAGTMMSAYSTKFWRDTGPRFVIDSPELAKQSYHITLEEMDELFRALIHMYGLTDYVKSLLLDDPDVRKAYETRNKHLL